MLVYDLPQGSDAWLRLRLGVPSTSSFGKIITPSGKRSSQFTEYCNELLAELILGEREQFFKSPAMERGNELEPYAVQHYEELTGRKTKVVGFVTTDDSRIGCSPDRLVGTDGLLEVKCPLQKKHVSNLVSGDIDKQYYPQVMGQLMMTGRQWVDWMSYHPDMPASIVRLERDAEFISTLDDLLNEFIEEMDKKINTLETKGVKFAIQVNKRPLKVEVV